LEEKNPAVAQGNDQGYVYCRYKPAKREGVIEKNTLFYTFYFGKSSVQLQKMTYKRRVHTGKKRFIDARSCFLVGTVHL